MNQPFNFVNSSINFGRSVSGSKFRAYSGNGTMQFFGNVSWSGPGGGYCMIDFNYIVTNSTFSFSYQVSTLTVSNTDSYTGQTSYIQEPVYEYKSYSFNFSRSFQSSAGGNRSFPSPTDNELGYQNLNTSNEHDGDSYAKIVSVANGNAAAGIGGMFDIGGIVDSYGDAEMYFTIGVCFGSGHTGGVGYSQSARTNIRTSAFEGLAVSYSRTIWGSVGIEVMVDNYFKNVQAVGTNIGVGKGVFLNLSYTFVFPAPPNDFWNRSGRHF